MSTTRRLLAIAVAASAVTGTVVAPAASADPGSIPSIIKPAGNAPIKSVNPVTSKDGYFTSTDPAGTKIWWGSYTVPNARGTVVVLHGAAENSGRYGYVISRLLDANYNVYTLDHRGHGKSSLPEVGNWIPRGHIDDFQLLVDDINTLVDKAKAEHPDSPLYLLGHSMGALAAQAYGIRFPGKAKGIVTNGGGAPFNLTGVNNGGQHITPRDISEVQKMLPPSSSDFLNAAQLTTFNARLAQEAIPGRRDLRVPSPAGSEHIMFPNMINYGVVSDPAVLAQYYTDPTVSKTVSLGMAEQLTVAGVYDGINADLFTTPTLIMAGDKDGLVPDYFSQDWYNAISSQDKQLIYWTGQMHEVFQEPAKAQAMDTVIDWLAKH